MKAPDRYREVTAIRIYCPIGQATLTALLAGDRAALDRDPALLALLTIIRAPNPLGDFGIYSSVVELAPGWELFTPAAEAAPALGTAGVEQLSPTAVLTVHVDAGIPPSALDPLLDALLAAHPWEVPVIELASTRLLLRRPD